MKGKAVSPEIRDKAKVLKGEGKSDAEIGKELHISASTVHRVTAEIEKPSGPDEAHTYLDSEARFLTLLQSYSIKSPPPGTIANYISSRGGGSAYSDLSTLKQCLTEQGIAPAKVSVLIRHWSSQEGLPLPSSVETELEPPVSRQPDKWSLIGDTPTRDQDGEFSFIQCLKLLEARRSQNQASVDGSEEVKLLRQELHNLELQQQEQKFQNLTNQIGSLADSVRVLSEKVTHGGSGRNEIDLLSELGNKGFTELAGLRSDVRGYFESQVLPRPKSLQERQQQRERLRQATEADRELQSLAEGIWGPAKLAPPAPKTAPAPPIIYE